MRRIPASSLRGQAVGVFVGSSTNDYSFLAVSDPTHRAPVRDHRHREFDHRQPGVVLLRLPRPVDGHRHRVLVLAGRHPPGRAGAARRRGRRGPGRRRQRADHPDGDDRVRRGRRRAGTGRPDQVVLARTPTATPVPRAAACWCSSGWPTPAATATRSSRSSRASAVNHDGRSNGLLAPNPDAQAEVLRKAYKDAGIDPRTVDYIEAHGTGTILGDPIEADALGRVVGRGRAADQPALLGAVKSNVGHLESAAGAASMAKVALAHLATTSCRRRSTTPDPTRTSTSTRNTSRSPDEVTEWPRYSGHAIAGVSGFGFGGANAHIVVREVLPSDLVEPEPESGSRSAEKPAADADAVYVGGVRMDEYGEFIHDDDDELTANIATPTAATSTTRRTRTARPDRRGAASARGGPRRA